MAGRATFKTGARPYAAITARKLLGQKRDRRTAGAAVILHATLCTAGGLLLQDDDAVTIHLSADAHERFRRLVEDLVAGGMSVDQAQCEIIEQALAHFNVRDINR